MLAKSSPFRVRSYLRALDRENKINIPRTKSPRFSDIILRAKSRQRRTSREVLDRLEQ